MTLPIIFLDVDGVINVFPGDVPLEWMTGDACPESGASYEEIIAQDEPKPKVAGGWLNMASPPPSTGRRFRITWDPTIIERLVKFHTDGLAEIRWLTTWGEGARGELSALLGMPDFICQHHPHEDELWSHDHWWKWRVVRDFNCAFPDVKHIWLDDDLAAHMSAFIWAQEREWLPIAPFQHKGLTHDDLDKIEAFLTIAGDEAV